MGQIHTNSILIRNKSDDSRATGLHLWLLPDGGTAPDDLIELTENTNLPGEYLFPSAVTNGKYLLYSGESPSQTPVQIGGQTVEVFVFRDGIIQESDCAFLKTY